MPTAVLSDTSTNVKLKGPNRLKPALKPSSAFSIPMIDLVYKTNIKPSERPIFKNSEEVARYPVQTWDRNKIEFQEQLKVLLLNRAGAILGIYEQSSGGHWQTCIEPKWIFTAAILANASQIILSHNHPSGSVQPGAKDIAVTEKIILGGNLLDIEVLDHIIVSAYGYYSFADHKRIHRLK